MNIKRVIKLIEKKYFPSSHQLMIRKWNADDGNYEKRFNYDLNDRSIAFDVGGYKGQWASDLFSRYRCDIIIFEPVSNYAKRIQMRFSRNEKIKVFPFGLGGETRTQTIYISEERSSIYTPNQESEIIKVVDIKETITNLGIDRIALMKINIEGGEYELLTRLIDTKLIKIIDNIQVQFHNISKDSQSQMDIIQERLRKTHKPTYQYEFVWENWTRKNT